MYHFLRGQIDSYILSVLFCYFLIYLVKYEIFNYRNTAMHFSVFSFY